MSRVVARVPVTFNFNHDAIIGEAVVHEDGSAVIVLNDTPIAKRLSDYLTTDTCKNISISTQSVGPPPRRWNE